MGRIADPMMLDPRPRPRTMVDMRYLLACAFLGVAVSCGGGGSEEALSGEPNLRLFLSDSPVDEAEAVYVMIDRVEVVRIVDGVETFVVVNDEDQEIELLALRNDVTAVIGEAALEPGQYGGVRLIVVGGQPGGGPPPRPIGPNRIVIGGEDFRLSIPSGAQTGLKLLDPFTIEEGKLTELLIDFNVRRSIVRRGTQDEYILKPRLTLVASTVRGAIEGTVTDSGTGNPVEGAVLSAQQAGDEIVSALSGPDGAYRLGPVAPATYDVVAWAKGYAPAAITDVLVPAGTIVGGRDFALDPAETGSISGTTLTDESAEVHLVWQGRFLAAAGPDPDTGGFSFGDVAVGTYDVVLFVGGAEADRVEDVVVAAGADTGGLTLGLP